MSTPLKIIIMLVIWCVYSFVAYSTCVKPQCCDIGETGDQITGPIENPPDTVNTVVRYPVDFQWNDPKAYQNEGFAALKDRLQREMADGKVLRIVGMYYESEDKPDGFENMGFARADAIKQLLIPGVPEDRIVIQARALSANADELEALQADSRYFEGSEFTWIDDPNAGGPVENEVEEVADRIIIRFPFNDTQKDLDPAVDAYLTTLAERLKSGNGSVSITGHTDNIGQDAYNQGLGMRRAQFVRRILIEQGVARDKISVDSKGESQPVDTNETDAGRHNNRRVEVRLTQ